MKKFTTVKDVKDINSMISTALMYKQSTSKHQSKGSGLRMGCIFLNPSMRTRLSTQIAAQNLGIETIVFNAGQDGWAMEFEDGAIMNTHTVEHIKDAAPILGSYFDILAVRTFPSLIDVNKDYSEYIINQLIKYSQVPVISLESATLHPLQSLADLITIAENSNNLNNRPKVVLTWAPHVKALPQCVANSFAEWVNAWGEAEFVLTHPEGYELDPIYTNGAYITHDQAEALQGADYVYVKNWSSYKHYGQILSNDNSWMLTKAHIAMTNNAKVMHCLPVRRNVELSDEVLDSPQSLVTQQASNRVWAAQAVLHHILEDFKI